MNRSPILWAGLLGIVACTATRSPPVAPGMEAFRRQTPPAGPTPQWIAPIPAREVLANGLTLLSVYKSDLPLVHVTLLLCSGSASDPPLLPGLASFLGEMLYQGTQYRSAVQLAEAVETLGTELSVYVDVDTTTLSAKVLTPHLDALLELLAEIVMAPAFAPKAIERTRKQQLAQFLEEQDSPDDAADRLIRRVLYGTHPYGHPALGDRAAIASIQRADLRAHHRQHFGPRKTALMLVGDLKPSEARQHVQEHLGHWQGGDGCKPPPSVPPERPAGVYLLDRPNASQAHVRVGHVGLPRSHPDFIALTMMNAVLGGGYNSRINLNLREGQGITYGAYSTFEFDRAAGPFVAYGAVEADATADALRSIIDEIHRIRDVPVTTRELEEAKGHYTLSLPGDFQTTDDIAAMMTAIALHDLPLDYYQRLAARVNSISVQEISRVARQFLAPEALSLVVVGDRRRIERSLTFLGRGKAQVVSPDLKGNHRY